MPTTMREIKKLDDLMDGGVNERFERALGVILGNVYDPNTSPIARRKISLEFTLTPDEGRDTLVITSGVKLDLAPPIPLKQTVLISQLEDGSVRAMVHSNQLPGQLNMDGDENIPNVVKFEAHKK